MKKLAFISIFCISCFLAQAQVAIIYTNDGQCELIQGSSVDALYPTANNGELCVRLLGGSTVSLGYGSLDSIVFTNRSLHVNTGNATNVTRTGATISGTVDWEIPATVGFLLSEDSNPNIGNSLVVAADYGTTFNADLSGLTMNTTYYYKAYAYVSGEYYYGDTKHFSTTGYAVGDLYPDDANPIGVVFSVNSNGSHGKIVSLTHVANVEWDSRDPIYITDTGGYSTTDGSLNPMIYAYSPVQQWIVDTLGEGWYCPATGELSTLCSHIEAVNATLESLGYNTHRNMFWASTQYNGAMAYIVCVGGAMGYSNGWSAYVSKWNIEDAVGVKKF